MHAFRISRDYRNHLNSVTQNMINAVPDSSNRDLWIKMGEQLEIDGVPRERISTIMKRDIEDMLYEGLFKRFMSRGEYKWHNNTYWIVTRERGWTNPDMARHTDPDRIRKTVPHANPNMKELCYDIINLCKMLADRSQHGASLEACLGRKEMEEFYRQRLTIISNCRNAIDRKTKAPRNTETFLLECLATVCGSVNKCAEVFMEQNLERLKMQGKFLTVKQATKFQKGMRQSRHFILKPPTRDMALYLDYAGVQCTCGSWRVRPRPDSYGLECYDCGKALPPAHVSKCDYCRVPLYKERLQHIVKSGRCENCNKRVDLPQELVDYARS
jgi:hypothetical protein